MPNEDFMKVFGGSQNDLQLLKTIMKSGSVEGSGSRVAAKGHVYQIPANQ